MPQILHEICYKKKMESENFKILPLGDLKIIFVGNLKNIVVGNEEMKFKK